MDATTATDRSPSTDRDPPRDAAPVRRPVSADLQREPSRAVDFALGMVVLVASQVPGLPGSISFGLVALAGLVAIGLTRRPTRALTGLGWMPGVAAVLLAYLVLVSISGPDLSLFGWPKRAMRLVLVLVALHFLVTGRIHYPSVVRGAAVGLLGNAVLFFAGVAPAPYGTLLSGYLLDKNQAGLSYAIVGILLLGLTESTRHRVVIALGATALVWTTGSRTSLAALACAFAWFVLRPRVGVAARAALATVIVVTLPFVQERYGQVGRFADRVGTDIFRARIDEASRFKLDGAPVTGQGLGEAWIRFADGATYFFHNSYWSVLVEGGWVYLAVVVVTTVWLAIRPLRQGPPPSPIALSAEAANIAVLICALRLGEVFGATTAIIALAAGFIGYLQAESLRRDAPDVVTVAR